MANALRSSVVILALLLVLQSLEECLCNLDKPWLNALFEGRNVDDFYDYCTNRSLIPCHLSSPEDFQRLRDAKQSMVDIYEFYVSFLRIIVLLGFQGVIMVLMTHLTIVKHFEWRSLPIINLLHRDEQFQDKTDGVTYQQYIWMRYLVLPGNHPVFHGRDFRDMSWYKYNKDVGNHFDYKSVHIRRFTFLDKKALTKHLVEDMENENEEEHQEGHIRNTL